MRTRRIVLVGVLISLLLSMGDFGVQAQRSDRFPAAPLSYYSSNATTRSYSAEGVLAKPVKSAEISVALPVTSPILIIQGQPDTETAPPEVRTYLSVIDKDTAQTVPGLTKDDFKLEELGKPVKHISQK